MTARTMTFATLIWITLLSPAAWAHRPTVAEPHHITDANAIFVEDIEVSQVVYWELSEQTPQLWLAFEGKAGQALYLQLGVPALARLQDYRPALVLLGPGLPEIALPFATPDALGGITIDLAQETRLFHEPFSDTDSWILAETTVELSQAGRYFAVMYHPQALLGKAWVALGKREAFGITDIAQLPQWLKQVRQFHEVPGQAPWLNTTIVILLALLAVGIVWWIRR